MMEQEPNRTGRKRSRHTLLWVIFIEISLVLCGLAVIIFLMDGKTKDPSLEKPVTIEYIEETEFAAECYVPRPEISEQLLSINEYSRPGNKIKELDYIVIHYLANPKTTAQENHDYFESLKDLQNNYMSANYVIGLNGEIIHCVPDDEVAYASNSANSYSISIENCHMDDTGKLNDATYDTLVVLTAYLSDLYNLRREQIIRHYDVTGKDCPKYFVENPDKWEAFRDQVMAYREECKVKVLSEHVDNTPRDDELERFLEENAKE